MLKERKTSKNVDIYFSPNNELNNMHGDYESFYLKTMDIDRWIVLPVFWGFFWGGGGIDIF